MKILNKLALILVAVMGMAISGCGGDIKDTPLVQISYSSDYITLDLHSPCRIADFYKTDKAIDKCWTKWEKIKQFKLVRLKGRRDCSNLSVKYDVDNKYIKIETPENCPPKNRLNKESYEFTIQTDYGTFNYDAGGKSLNVYATYGGYMALSNKGGKK